MNVLIIGQPGPDFFILSFSQRLLRAGANVSRLSDPEMQDSRGLASLFDFADVIVVFQAYPDIQTLRLVEEFSRGHRGLSLEDRPVFIVGPKALYGELSRWLSAGLALSPSLDASYDSNKERTLAEAILAYRNRTRLELGLRLDAPPVWRAHALALRSPFAESVATGRFVRYLAGAAAIVAFSALVSPLASLLSGTEIPAFLITSIDWGFISLCVAVPLAIFFETFIWRRSARLLSTYRSRSAAHSGRPGTTVFLAIALLLMLPLLAAFSVPGPIARQLLYDSRETQTVYFATDRAAVGPNDPAMYSLEPNETDDVWYGRAQVFVPWRGDRGARLVVLGRHSKATQQPTLLKADLSRDEFFKEVSLVVGKSPARSAFLFVHGFRVTFAEGLMSSAQLARDLKFDGAAILFSWPAGDSVGRYVGDIDNVDWSSVHLTALLASLAQHTNARNFQLIAHSMGSRVLTLAIRGLKEKEIPEKPFDNIVLAAADLTKQLFLQTAPEMTRRSSRLTLYVCRCDNALRASKIGHGGPPIGLEKQWFAGADVVDANTADLDLIGLNHSYILASQLVLSDLYVLFRYGEAPDRRANLARVGCCWDFMSRR